MKDVEIILRSLIQMAYKENRQPIKLNIESSLYNELRKRFKNNTKDKFEVVANGIIYHPEEEPITLETYMGIPVEESHETVLYWKL